MDSSLAILSVMEGRGMRANTRRWCWAVEGSHEMTRTWAKHRWADFSRMDEPSELDLRGSSESLGWAVWNCWVWEGRGVRVCPWQCCWAVEGPREMMPAWAEHRRADLPRMYEPSEPDSRRSSESLGWAVLSCWVLEGRVLRARPRRCCCWGRGLLTVSEPVSDTLSQSEPSEPDLKGSSESLGWAVMHCWVLEGRILWAHPRRCCWVRGLLSVSELVSDTLSWRGPSEPDSRGSWESRNKLLGVGGPRIAGSSLAMWLGVGLGVVARFWPAGVGCLLGRAVNGHGSRIVGQICLGCV